MVHAVACRCTPDLAHHLISRTEILVENSSNQALRRALCASLSGALQKLDLID